ncbi:MAG: flavodoxin domain-containing protein [Actinomycetota bacterium]
MKVLVAYASKHGSTEGIAKSIADRLRENGHEATPVRAEEVDDIGDIDAAVIGSAIYAGSWMKEATSLVERQTAALQRVPVWLFSSGPLGSEVKDEQEQPRQLGRLTDLLQPRGHEVFFGALDREKLGFGERMLVKAVKAPEGDFRDWDAIWAWTDVISRELND